MHLIRFVYHSTALVSDAMGLLEEIAPRCRRANQLAGITSLVTAADGRFFHILEGPRPAVTACLSRIRRSRAHRDLQVLIDQRIDRLSPGLDPFTIDAFDTAARFDLLLTAETRQFNPVYWNRQTALAFVEQRLASQTCQI